MGNKITKPRRISRDRETVTRGGNTGHASIQETSPALSSPVTLTGLEVNGSLQADTLVSVVNSGDNNTYNYYAQQSSTPRPESIEFNTQECISTFTGRDEFIKTMHTNIWRSEPPNNPTVRSQFIVICGMAGVGKTQVVRKYIQTYKHLYDHVIWINAESKSEVITCFLRLAAKVKVDVNQNGVQKAEQDIFEEVYNIVFQKCALIVYDNVGSYNAEDGKDGLRTLLPRTIKSGWKVPSIILTTRNRNWPNFVIQELTGFDLSKSLSFLSTLDFTSIQDHQKLLEEVANMCQGLPLALQQVLTFVQNKREIRMALHEEPYTLVDFLEEVKFNQGTFISTAPTDSEYSNVYALFAMTFSDLAIMKHGELALQCLDVMAILNPDFIPTSLIKSIFRNFKHQLAEGLVLLNKYNLITRCDNFYQMHRIVQAAKIEYNINNSTVDYVKHNFEEILKSVTVLLEGISTNTENVLEILNNLVQDQAPETNSKLSTNFQTVLGCKFQEAGSYKPAIKLFQNALEAQTELLGLDHLDTIRTKHNLASVLRNHGKYSDAQIIYTEVLQIRTKSLGPVHPDTLRTKHGLATVFNDQGENNEAENLYNEILHMQIKTLGPNHPETLGTQNNLAMVLRAQGKYNDAEEIFNEILEMHIKTVGADHPDTLRIKHNLAMVLDSQGKYNDAEKLYKEVLQMEIKVLGPDHPDTRRTKHNLAMVFDSQGKYDDAVEIYKEVLQMEIKLLYPDHPDTLRTKHNLAIVFDNQGRYNDAEELFKEVLEIRIKILGPVHPDTLITQHCLAVVFDNQGKHNDAEMLYNEVLQTRIKTLGSDHPETLRTKHNLAVIFLIQGKYADAEEVLNEVLKIRIKLLGPANPDTLASKHNLAMVVVNRGKYIEAEEIFKEVLQIRLEMLGPVHPDTLGTKHNLAMVLMTQGKYTDAEELFNEVLQMQIKTAGPDHPNTLRTKHKLAIVFERQGKHNNAKDTL